MTKGHGAATMLQRAPKPFRDSLEGLGKFDLITALSVLFRLDSPLPRESWEKAMREIAAHTAPGGIIMVYRSDFDPKDVLGNDFKDLNVWSQLHNRNSKSYFCGYYQKKRWYNRIFP